MYTATYWTWYSLACAKYCPCSNINIMKVPRVMVWMLMSPTYREASLRSTLLPRHIEEEHWAFGEKRTLNVSQSEDSGKELTGKIDKQRGFLLKAMSWTVDIEKQLYRKLSTVQNQPWVKSITEVSSEFPLKPTFASQVLIGLLFLSTNKLCGHIRPRGCLTQLHWKGVNKTVFSFSDATLQASAYTVIQ